MGLQSRLIVPFLILILLGLSGSVALTQNTAPAAMPAAQEAGMIDPGRITLATPNGSIAALATVAENHAGVTLTVTSTGDSGLAPGKHGVHIHNTGACDASGITPYASAGDHFNPAGHEHGEAGGKHSHAGDLGNLTVKDDGSIDFTVTTRQVTLEPGRENSLDNPGGSSLVIHAGEDDHATQPAGDSGDRLACGIIFRSHEPVTHAMPGHEDTATP